MHACSFVFNTCNPMDCSPPGSSIHGIFQAIILERATISHSGGSSRPKDWTHIYFISCLGRLIIYPPPGKSSIYHIVNIIVYLVITFCKWVQLYLTCHGMWQWILNGKVNKYYILWLLGTQDICLSRPAYIFSSTRRRLHCTSFTRLGTAQQDDVGQYLYWMLLNFLLSPFSLLVCTSSCPSEYLAAPNYELLNQSTIAA